MIYQQTKNNGVCTANLEVAPYGWNQLARAEFSRLEPLPGCMGDGYEIADWDKGPLVIGTLSLTCDEDFVWVQDFETDHGHAYWQFQDVVKEYVAQVPYGETRRFVLAIENLIFSHVSGVGPNGRPSTLSNVSLDVRDEFIFRQREDTGSYGSKSARMLFWPYQNER